MLPLTQSLSRILSTDSYHFPKARTSPKRLTMRDGQPHRAKNHHHLSRTLGLETLEKRQLLAADFLYGGNGGGPPEGRVKGELIVQFRAGVSPDQIKGIYQANDAAELEKLYGMERTRRVWVPEKAADQVLKAFANHPLIEFAEPNFLATSTALPNDPYLSYQWNFGGSEMGGINVEQAWEMSTGLGATIAVLDTGVAYENHSDASGNYYVSPDLNHTRFVSGYDFINGDQHANDDQGHGTHVAGTIAQSTGNGTGVAGIAYNASIMPIKVLGADGSGSYTSIANGIRWAADQGADIINLSLGGGSPSILLEDALAYAYGLGVTIVAAAGNDGVEGVSYPAAYDDYVIAVSATRLDSQLAPYSNYGSSIDIAAPGGDVSVDQNGDGFGDGILQSTFSGETSAFNYYFFQGTSMATPHVAGVAGLIVSLGVTDPAQVKDLLVTTAQDRGPSGVDPLYGHGTLDAGAAVTAAINLNKMPSAADDYIVGSEDVVMIIQPLLNDTDPDGDSLTITGVTSPNHGSAVLEPDGSISYKPDPNYHGSDQFTYTITDGSGGEDTGTVHVTLESVMDARVAALDARLPEGDSDLTPYRFEIKLDETSQTDSVFDWSLLLNQTSNADFASSSLSGTVIVAAGNDAATFDVLVAGDDEIEPNEEFFVGLTSGPQGVQLGKQLASGFIINDDGSGEYSYHSHALTETSLHGAYSNSLDVTHQSDEISEVITEELYQRNRRSRLEHQWEFNVVEGDLGVQFTVVAGHDSDRETFRFEYDSLDGLGWRSLITLSGKKPASYIHAMPAGLSGRVVARVVDSDRQQNEASIDSVMVDQIGFISRRSVPLPPLVTIETIDAYGSEWGNEPVSYRFTLDRELREDLVIQYEFSGTATSADFVEAIASDASIPAGSRFIDVSLTPIDDQIEEGTEFLTISLVSTGGYELGKHRSATLTIDDDDKIQKEFFPTAQSSTAGDVLAGDLTSLQSLDDNRLALEEHGTGGRPAHRVSYLDHRWSFDVDQAQSFLINAYRPNNTEDENFVFQISNDGGTQWKSLVTIASDAPTQYTISLGETLTGDVLVRVVDTDPRTKGNGDRDQVWIDQMFFSTDTTSMDQSSVSTRTNTLTGTGDQLRLERSKFGVVSMNGHSGQSTKVSGVEFRTVVKKGQQFDNDSTWKTERVEIRNGKMVQIASDGILTMVVEEGGWRNFVSPSDVNNDHKTSALDVLAIINEMTQRRFSGKSLGKMIDETHLMSGEAMFFDQNGDGSCTALDALRVINDLARSSVTGEGEAVTPDYWSRGVEATRSHGMKAYEDPSESKLEETELLPSDTDPETSHTSVLPKDIVYAKTGQESTEAVDSLLSDLEVWWK